MYITLLLLILSKDKKPWTFPVEADYGTHFLLSRLTPLNHSLHTYELRWLSPRGVPPPTDDHRRALSSGNAAEGRVVSIRMCGRVYSQLEFHLATMPTTLSNSKYRKLTIARPTTPAFVYVGFTNGRCTQVSLKPTGSRRLFCQASPGISPQSYSSLSMARCSHASCSKASSSNVKSSKTAVYCRQHGEESMENVRKRRRLSLIHI